MTALPLLALGIFCVALCLAAALTPAHALPWEWASQALAVRREELAFLLGAFGFLATALFFVFVLASA
jgi:hypothetical protein